MKMHELNAADLLEVNGGSANSTSGEAGLLGQLGIGNLLSFEHVSQNGDQMSGTAFSVGNGIQSSLGGILGFGQQSAS